MSEEARRVLGVLRKEVSRLHRRVKLGNLLHPELLELSRFLRDSERLSEKIKVIRTEGKDPSRPALDGGR